MEQFYILNLITQYILVKKFPIHFWILFKQKKSAFFLIHDQNDITLMTLYVNHSISLMVQLFLSYINDQSLIYLFFAQQKKKSTTVGN